MNKPKSSTSVTYSVMILCVFITLFINYNENLGNSATLNAIKLGALYTPLVKQNHEFYRLYTSGFIHISFWHLFVNMYSFYLLGTFCENNLGHWKFFILLSVSVIAGNAVMLLLPQESFVVGLSGGLYGLLVFEVMLLKKAKLLENPTVKASLMGAFIINLAINFLPNVAWAAHVGGALGGFLVSYFFLHHTYHD